MDYSALGALLVGYGAQWGKAHKNIPTVLIQLGCMAAVFALYAAQFHYSASDAQWLTNGIARAAAAVGVSSFSGASGLAPKTDSIGGK